MEYIFVIIITIIVLPLHWHYYRWCIFNNKINRPSIYWSYKGDLIVLVSKLLWFGVILFFFKWYFIFIPLIILFVLKEIAFSKSLNAVKKEYIVYGKSEKEAEEIARREIKDYHR